MESHRRTESVSLLALKDTKNFSSNKQMIRMFEKATVDRIHFDFKFSSLERLLPWSSTTFPFFSMHISLIYKRFYIHSLSLSTPRAEVPLPLTDTIP